MDENEKQNSEDWLAYLSDFYGVPASELLMSFTENHLKEDYKRILEEKKFLDSREK